MIALAAGLRVQAGLADLQQRRYAFDVKPRWPLAALAGEDAPRVS
jgi:N6-L-threonylcarbamoyladenine synthase